MGTQGSENTREKRGMADGRSRKTRDAAVRLCLLGRTEKGHTGNLNNRAA